MDLFDKYAPSALSKREVEELQEKRMIFVGLFSTDAHLGYPHVRKYLPELFAPDIIEKMAADPWLDVKLLGKAKEQGHVPRAPGASSRWSPEWRAYCDRLIASSEYK